MMDENTVNVFPTDTPQEIPAAQTVPAEEPVPEQPVPVSAPMEEPHEEAPVPPKAKKKLNKKVLIIGIAAVLVIALAIGLVSLLCGGTKSNAVFIKDNEVWLYIEGMKEPLRLSSRLGKEADSYEEFISKQIDEFAFYVAVRNNGSTVFYPDKFVSQGEGVTLYYRNANKPEKDPVKVDTKVYTWYVSTDGKQVLYLKYESKGFSLHLYDVKSEEDIRISKDIANEHRISWAEDFSSICYLSDEKVYLWTPENEEVKIAKHASSFMYFPESDTIFVKTKDGELLVKTAGMEACEEVAEDISTLLATYSTGEAYYLRKSSVERCLLDYLEDDMKAEDSVMAQPKKPNYPTAPQRVYYWNYATEEEYEEAKKQYDLDYAAYQEQYNALKEEYNNAMALYNLKLDRDAVREALKERVMEYEEYALYYYDGSEEHLLSDALVTESLKARATDASVAVYTAYTPAELIKPKLSEIEDMWDAPYMVQQAIKDALYTESELYLTIGGETTVIEHADASNFLVSKDGTAVYFLDAPFVAYRDTNAAYADAPAAEAPAAEDSGEEEEPAEELIPKNQREYAALYRITVADGKGSSPELVDSDISIDYAPRITDGKLICFKETDPDDRTGELYVDGQFISDDVIWGNYLCLEDHILFVTDWDSEDRCGTLHLMKLGDDNAEATEIADDVYRLAITESGDVLYLQDYSQKRYEGTLFLYDMSKKKAAEIADDVACLGYPR